MVTNENPSSGVGMGKFAMQRSRFRKELFTDLRQCVKVAGCSSTVTGRDVCFSISAL
jgi:hypothetical protein